MKAQKKEIYLSKTTCKEIMAEKIHKFVADENENSLSSYFSFCHLTEVMNM